MQLLTVSDIYLIFYKTQANLEGTTIAYASWSVFYGEQPSAAKWNILGSNDAAFNDGTGLPMAGADTASVLTEETTTSVSATNLATVGPSVTVTVGATGKVWYSIAALMHNSSTGQFNNVYLTASGANTINANGTQWFAKKSATTTADIKASTSGIIKNLTPGSTVFTLQYSVSGGTGSFSVRDISIMPL